MGRALMLGLMVTACRPSADASTDAPPTLDYNPPTEAIVPSVRCATELGRFGGLQWQARTQGLSGPGPNVWNACNAWLAMDGLHLRIERHVSNAQAVAEFLSKHPTVTSVSYSGLPSHPSYAKAKKYLPRGAGSVLTFEIKGGVEAGKAFINALKLHSHLANVGDSKSLAIHPASTTHQQLSAADQAAAGVTPGLVRLSVGVEGIDDIIWDLDQALKQAAKAAAADTAAD